MSNAMTAESRPPKSKARGTFVVLLGILLAASAVWAWSAFRYDFIPKRFGIVVPGSLYRSGQISPRLIRSTLQEHNIQLVIDFQGARESDAAQSAEQQAVNDLHIEYKRLPLAGDGTGDITRYA